MLTKYEELKVLHKDNEELETLMDDLASKLEIVKVIKEKERQVNNKKRYEELKCLEDISFNDVWNSYKPLFMKGNFEIDIPFIDSKN